MILSLPLRHFAFVWFALLIPLYACAGSDHGTADNPKPGYIYGKVVGITDGDTLKLLTSEKKTVKIRLAEIDTPERRQPYGKRAKQALSDLAFQKPVAVKVVTIDRYGRTVGRIYIGDLDISAEMVRVGAAWVYREYAKDQNLYTLEDEARADKRGLWGLPEDQRVPPWECASGERRCRR